MRVSAIGGTLVIGPPDLARSAARSGADGGGAASTALLCDLACKKHLTGAGHPERPDRLDAIQRALEGMKPGRGLIRIKARS